jgi:O-antigen/teichoic acid export membrane protein
VGISLKGSSRTLGWITVIGAGVTIAMNTALVPTIGMMGSAVATVSSYGVMAFVLSIRSQAAYPIPTPWWVGVSMLLTAFLVPMSIQEAWFGELSNLMKLWLTIGGSVVLLAAGWMYNRQASVHRS